MLEWAYYEEYDCKDYIVCYGTKIIFKARQDILWNELCKIINL